MYTSDQNSRSTEVNNQELDIYSFLEYQHDQLHLFNMTFCLKRVFTKQIILLYSYKLWSIVNESSNILFIDNMPSDGILKVFIRHMILMILKSSP